MSLGPLPPVPNWLRIVLRGAVDNIGTYPWANVCHFLYSGTPPADAVCSAIATGVQAAWSAHMASTQPSPSQLTEVQVTDLTSDSAGQGTWLGNVPGTRGDDSIPANAAMLVSYPASTRYRGGHPRQYLYVLGNADLTGAAEWTSAATAEVNTKWIAFLTACEAISDSGTALGSFGTIRYYGKFLPNSGAPRYRLDTPIPIPIPVSEAVCAQEIASQRRRVGRRKR